MKPGSVERHRRYRVHGIDFSGAKDAGRKIGIASGIIEADTLCIQEYRRAESLPGSARERTQCLAALRRFIESRPGDVFGLDFPFGLPREMVRAHTWEEFVLSFSQRYPSPEQFRAACRMASQGLELRRITDRESAAPFSPYNLRLFRQTYYGIRDLLAPLVQTHTVCVLPMQDRLTGKPWLLEICPASTLRWQGLKLRYKGRKQEYRAARAWVLEHLEVTGHVSLASPGLRTLILEDNEGDGLDSVLAALATGYALRNEAQLTRADPKGAYALEGYIYVQ